MLMPSLAGTKEYYVPVGIKKGTGEVLVQTGEQFGSKVKVLDPVLESLSVTLDALTWRPTQPLDGGHDESEMLH
jgi:hypothetical protein